MIVLEHIRVIDTIALIITINTVVVCVTLYKCVCLYVNHLDNRLLEGIRQYDRETHVETYEVN